MDTNDKLKRLTEKIYFEGVEKAKKEAELIIANAKKEADNIINSAKKKEKELIEQIQKEAKEVKINTDTEIRMASQQFISNLKQQIVELIAHKQVEPPVKEAFNDKAFVQNMILTTIKNWNNHKNGDLDIRVLLPGKDEKELRDFFHTKAKELLNSGLEIDFIPSIKSGFKIGPKNGNYHISFTDIDFENYFKNYVKDKTRKIIFEN
jgi:V/A-type H+-transporting ATPase subunit E